MTQTIKKSVWDSSYTELVNFMSNVGEPNYRALQLWQGLYKDIWPSSDQATTLPVKLRDLITETYHFTNLLPEIKQTSKDNQTEKTLFRLTDGHYIETVLLRYEKRRTLCVSSQAGCAMGCGFCATGQIGFKRHLTPGEIILQVLFYERELRKTSQHISNIVIMGMGEPFHNYDNTMAAINRISDERGFNFGERRITISTVGLVPEMRRFADENRQVNLAVSLHTTDNLLREKLIPITKKYPIESLLETCRYYVIATNRRITFEWALMDGLNDKEEHAIELAKKVKGILCHINLIRLNPTPHFPTKPTSSKRSALFCQMLMDLGLSCSMRLYRGIDIQGGCGQLAGK